MFYKVFVENGYVVVVMKMLIEGVVKVIVDEVVCQKLVGGGYGFGVGYCVVVLGVMNIVLNQIV